MNGKVPLADRGDHRILLEALLPTAGRSWTTSTAAAAAGVRQRANRRAQYAGNGDMTAQAITIPMFQILCTERCPTSSLRHGRPRHADAAERPAWIVLKATPWRECDPRPDNPIAPREDT